MQDAEMIARKADQIPSRNRTRDLYTMSEVCDKLRLSPSTVRRITRAGLIPHIRVAGSVRYKAADVDQILAEGTK